jgi:plastocyanin
MKLRALLLLCLLICSVACQKQPTNTARVTPSRPTIQLPADPAAAAELSGTVSFQGAPPRRIPIDMSADAGCRGENYSESLVVNDGRLQNVFVYLKGGFAYAPPAQPVVVEQRGCRYVPHVVGVTVSQPVEYRNTDPTIHNIHGMPKDNDAWNVSQTGQSPAMTRVFHDPELMIPVKCNQHPWMHMYINVVDSPFFAVTDAQGHFELKGIPPGTYDLVFVHESMGQQVHAITLAPKQHATMDVSFSR